MRLSDIFTSSEVQLLKKGNILTYTKMDGKGEVFTGGLKASFPRSADIIYKKTSGNRVAAVEKIFFRGKPDLENEIFNKLINYPVLKGMSYYSISEGKGKPLILESYISGRSEVKRDGSRSSALSSFTIKDNRLGTIPFRGEVWAADGAVYSASVCSGTVSRFGMSIFEPGDYRVYKFIIYDKKAGGWFYCSVQLMNVRSNIMNRLDLLKPENICNRVRGESLHILGLLGVERKGEFAAFR